MSNIIGDTACPACVARGRDSTLNHLILYADGGKHCNKCGYTDQSECTNGEPSFTHDEQEQEEEIDTMKLSGVKELPMHQLTARNIDLATARQFRVRTEYNNDGDQVAHYYPITSSGILCNYKKRTLPKQFSIVGDSMKGVPVQLFGQATCSVSSKKLLITGGQDDALAAYYMLFAKYPKYKPSVVSVVNGEGLYDITNNLEWITQFEEIIICMDMDKAGEKAAKDICQLIGPAALNMTLPLNDPNDMLIAGRGKEFIDCFFKAKHFVPDGVVSVEDAYEAAIAMPEWGRGYPWPTLEKLTYGRRDGEGIYIGAGVKAGKTEWKHQMVHHITEHENKPVLMFNFEQGHGHTVKAVAGKNAHMQFHKPDGNFTQEELINAVDAIKGKLIMFDASYSDVGKANMWDRMKPVIRHAVLAKGVKDVFIDPITQLTDGLTPSETETELRRFSNEIQGMAQDLGFFYYCFCHLKEPHTGKTHEEGGGVKVAQFRGSRAMAEKTKYMLGIIRDQYSDDEEERDVSTFHLLLNSGFGKSGKFSVVYDATTGDYLEPVASKSF